MALWRPWSRARGRCTGVHCLVPPRPFGGAGGRVSKSRWSPTLVSLMAFVSSGEVTRADFCAYRSQRYQPRRTLECEPTSPWEEGRDHDERVSKGSRNKHAVLTPRAGGDDGYRQLQELRQFLDVGTCTTRAAARRR